MAVETRSIAVVGGGIVGLSVAWSLRRRGAEVTVFERDRCGGAASTGNAGWITPGLSHPVPGPGVLGQSLRWMLDPESPFLIRPRADPALAGWGLRFARACTRGRQRAGLEATYALARSATGAYDSMEADGVAFESHADGLLYLVRDAEHLDAYVRAYDELAGLGFDGRVLVFDRTELAAFEPTVGPGVAGGLLGGAERHVRPETVCAGLVAWLREAGARVVEGTAVTDLTRPGGERFDHVVVAAGAWSGELVPGLAMEAAKGYSVTAPAAGAVPARPLYLTEAKTAVTPFDGALRFAGTLELAGLDLSVNRRRLDAVVDSIGAYVEGVALAGARVEWAGLRPMPADGLPLVGPLRFGLSVATGHGMLGVTLGPVTGEALAESILEGRPLPAALRPDRFMRGRAPA